MLVWKENEAFVVFGYRGSTCKCHCVERKLTLASPTNRSLYRLNSQARPNEDQDQPYRVITIRNLNPLQERENKLI
jgi:hypothetical protein